MFTKIISGVQNEKEREREKERKRGGGGEELGVCPKILVGKTPRWGSSELSDLLLLTRLTIYQFFSHLMPDIFVE